MSGTGFILSLFTFTVGAILHWAVADRVSGVDLAMIGTILMVVSIVGFVASLFAWLSERRRTETVAPVAPVERGPVVERERIR